METILKVWTWISSKDTVKYWRKSKEELINELEDVWKIGISNGQYETASAIRDMIKRIKEDE